MKKVIFLLSVVLFACNQPHKITAVTDPIPKGNKVVYLYPYYTDYVRSLGTDTSGYAKCFNEKVRDPIINSYFLKCEYSNFAQHDFSYPIYDTVGLVNNIALVTNNRSKIDELISTALTDANKYLRNDSITVYILPLIHDFKEKIKRMGGITGSTVGSREILITIDPEVKGWETNLKDAIAHEFNHAYWAKIHPPTNASDWTLLADLISEGKADSYAHLIYPTVHVPWTSMLSDSGRSALWNRIKPQLFSTDGNLYFKVMFGSDTSKTYPKWGGYSLGYAIVQSALKNNPQLMPAEWSALKPEELLKMSDYKL